MDTTEATILHETGILIAWLRGLSEKQAAKAMNAIGDELIERIVPGLPAHRLPRMNAAMRATMEPFLVWLRALPCAEAMMVHDALNQERLNQVLRQLAGAHPPAVSLSVKNICDRKGLSPMAEVLTPS